MVTTARDAVISGLQKTKDRIWREFWWPGFGADVIRFCRSCDICQKTIAKRRVPSVPLGKMLIIDTPFERVAVDLVGPIHPVTERGNRYILTFGWLCYPVPRGYCFEFCFTERSGTFCFHIPHHLYPTHAESWYKIVFTRQNPLYTTGCTIGYMQSHMFSTSVVRCIDR